MQRRSGEGGLINGQYSSASRQFAATEGWLIELYVVYLWDITGCVSAFGVVWAGLAEFRRGDVGWLEIWGWWPMSEESAYEVDDDYFGRG